MFHDQLRCYVTVAKEGKKKTKNKIKTKKQTSLKPNELTDVRLFLPAKLAPN